MPPKGKRLQPQNGTLIERVAGWSIRHRALAIGGWLALVVLAVLSTALVSGDSAVTKDPGESGAAQQVLNEQKDWEPVLENVLVQSRDKDGPAFKKNPELQQAVKDLVAEFDKTPGAVSQLRTPLNPRGEQQISADGRSGLVTFFVAGPNTKMDAHFDAVVDAVHKVADRHKDIRLVQAGDQSLSRAVDDAVKKDFASAESTSLPITLVILLIVFGALVAAAVPLLLAATAVAAAFGLIGVLGQWVAVNSAVSSMILLIGVAVSIDYSLFYLRREREERAAGRSVAEALRITAKTSGHVVAVSGITVMLCVSGLLLSGLDVFRGLTLGTVLIVGLAMIGSVTVLPALLAALGHRVDKGRIPWLGKRRTTVLESRTWRRLAQKVVKRPLVWGGAAVVALVVMALPMFSMHLQDAAVVNSLPRSAPTVDAAIRMQDAFPGSPTPARIAVWNTGGGSPDTPAVRAAVGRLHDEIAASGGRLSGPVSTVRVDDVLVVRVPLAGSGTDADSNRALETLRDTALPRTLGKVDGVEYATAGRTAFAHDFADQLSGRTFAVIAFVLVLAFVLLLLVFRSLTIPLVSIALNLLSMGASYGVLTWVFQYGNLSSALGFTSYGGVAEWLPLFMFVVLFGLSMDYHIFILSRIRERRLAGAEPRDAVVGGVAASAGVVTSAAVIMTAVFTIFITLSAIENKMMGVGMAVAILIDATLVRGILLPAALALLGKRAWELPRGLRRLPGGTSRPAPAGPAGTASRPTEGVHRT
ncbi:MMPL family transporter [Streptomyces sp. NRRL B-3648]|uniref:MMPL family transporter n=1 Tax=Streptomyces sp. NRRL B-3648 TaxID=1519493 RepID=UPI0006BFB1B9|nr:MMPL family transporter [Streptomyces sp. NRRL B-3648]KOV91946.1 MMPL domain-containing protein [Streptomyces sp. NRRL B-3648]